MGKTTTIDIDRDLTSIDRDLIRISYHEQVKSWISEGIAYPITLAVSFWCIMSIIEKLI